MSCALHSFNLARRREGRFFPHLSQIVADFGPDYVKMAFEETYQAEVITSRRIRSQRVQFWAKALGVLLMIMIAAILRSEPELRSKLTTAAMDGVMAVTGSSGSASSNTFGNSPSTFSGGERTVSPTSEARRLQRVLSEINAGGIGSTQTDTTSGQNRDAVKVNRFGNSQGGSIVFQRAPGVILQNNSQLVAPKMDQPYSRNFDQLIRTGQGGL